uniref:Uncharacterized protein n=1 Tax=Oryza glumipatula TaxID=40148 RepID=A0A0D9YGN4_9ORYZ
MVVWWRKQWQPCLPANSSLCNYLVWLPSPQQPVIESIWQASCNRVQSRPPKGSTCRVENMKNGDAHGSAAVLAILILLASSM